MRLTDSVLLSRNQPSSIRLLWKHVPHPRLQPFQDVLQLAQRDALIAVFQPEQRGGRDAEALGKHRVALVATLLPQEPAELLVEGLAHVRQFC